MHLLFKFVSYILLDSHNLINLQLKNLYKNFVYGSGFNLYYK